MENGNRSGADTEWKRRQSLMRKLFLLLTLLAWSCNATTVEEKRMDKNIQDKLIDAVHSDFDWKKNEIRIDEVDRLKRGPCSFYTAGHLVRPIAYVPNYAVIGGEQVLNAADKNVSKILDACGKDAPAGWWAEIITRFHQDLGAGIVLENASENSAAIRKISEAKREFMAPAFGSEKGSKTISYYLLEPEGFLVFFVKAYKNTDGSVTVERTEVG
jgi:hypothetical protein